MAIAQTSLDASRRQMVWWIGLTTAVAGLILAPVVAISLGLFGGSTPVVFLLVSLLCSIVGGGGTLLLLRSHPLWQAVLPATAIILLQEIGVALFVSDILTLTLPYLLVVVLMTCLSGNRRLSVAGVVVSTVLAAILIIGISASLLPRAASSLGDIMLPVQVVAICALIIIVWLVVDRLIHAQDTAIALADRQTRETEAARLETERSRTEIEARATEQQRLLDLVSDLETPAITLTDRVLLVPIVGNLDTHRTSKLSQRLLETVSEQRAQLVVLDLQGVRLVDTAVARALLSMISAVRLLGCDVMVSGLSAVVATTMVELGVNLETVQTVRSPQEALMLIAPDLLAKKPSNNQRNN